MNTTNSDTAKATKKRSTRHCPPPPTPYPWLVYRHGKNTKNQTFYSLSEPNNSYVKSIPELQNKTVWQSCHGWLVLSDDNFHPWNPVTLELIDLPPLELQTKQYTEEIVLTAPPDNLDSTLLQFVRNPDCIISFNKGCLVEIEIVNSSSLVIRPMQCGQPIFQSLWHRMKRYWLESCGDIFTIKVELGGVGYNQVINIVIFKLDLSAMVWNRVVSCPDRAFFLSQGEAYSCPVTTADAARLGNRVFFTRHQDKHLYSDDLPRDILAKASAHLTPFDYMNFRAVSKECRSVAPPKQWRTLSESVELEKQILSPWLMLHV